MERTRRALVVETGTVEKKTVPLKEAVGAKLTGVKEVVKEEASELMESAEKALWRIDGKLIPYATEEGYVATPTLAPKLPINPFPAPVAPKPPTAPVSAPIPQAAPPAPPQPRSQPVVQGPLPQLTPKPAQTAESLDIPRPTTSEISQAPRIILNPDEPATQNQTNSLQTGVEDKGPKFSVFSFFKHIPKWGKVAVAMSPLVVGIFVLIGIYLNHNQAAQNKVASSSPTISNASAGVLASGEASSLKLNVDTSVGKNKLLSAAGPVAFKNATDSTRAFSVQNAAGNDLLLVDTKDNKIVLGSSDQTITLQIAGSVSITGNITIANANGTTASLTPAGLTLGSLVVCTVNGCIPNNKDAVSLQGENLAFLTNASNINSGTLSDSRLSTNVALLDASQIFTGANNLSNSSNVFNGTYSGNGSGITNLNATNVSSGTLQDARLTGNVALLNRSGQIFTGSQVVQNTSLSAFQVQNSGGAVLLSADTTDSRIGIGTSSPTDTFNVVGNTSIMQSSVSAPSITASGNEITDATRQSAVQGDGQTYPDSSYGIWLPTTNLAPNGGFENGVTGWQASGSATAPAKDITTAKFGSASMKVATNGVASGEGATTGSNGALGILGATNYTASAWVKGSGTITLTVNEYSGAHGLLKSDTSSVVTLNSSWQRVTVSFLTHASAAFDDITLVTNATEATTFWADGIQLEKLAAPTPYVDTNGSTASRNAARVQIPTTGLNTAQGWVAARIRFDNPSSICLEGGTARLFEWVADSNNRILMNYNCQSTQFEGLWVSNGFAVVKATSYTFTSGSYITVVMKWSAGQSATSVSLSVNGSAFSTQPAGTLPALNLSSVPMFDLGSSLGNTAHMDGDIMWFTAGSGTMTDSDPGTLYALGNTDPNMTTLPSASQTQLTWQANNAFYLNTTYQPIVMNVRNSLGQSMFGVDASSSSILMPGVTSASSALILGNDANLYRNAAGSLKTDGNFTTGGNLTVDGTALFQDLNNSTAAFQIQNSSGTSLLTVDTTNTAITINAALNVSGTLTISSGSLVTSSSGIYTSTIPASPVNGQEIYYVADSTNGIIWHLRYNSSEPTYKWEFLGGESLRATAVGGTVGAASTDTLMGSGVTLPRTGEYDVTFGGQMMSVAASQQEQMRLRLYDNAAAITPLASSGYNTANVNITAATGNNTGANVTDEFVFDGSATDLLKWYAYVLNSGSYAQNLWMRVTPVRIN